MKKISDEENMWACEMCTFLNPKSSNSCEVCSSDRKKQPEQKSQDDDEDLRGGFDEFQADIDKRQRLQRRCKESTEMKYQEIDSDVDVPSSEDEQVGRKRKAKKRRLPQSSRPKEDIIKPPQINISSSSSETEVEPEKLVEIRSGGSKNSKPKRQPDQKKLSSQKAEEEYRIPKKKNKIVTEHSDGEAPGTEHTEDDGNTIIRNRTTQVFGKAQRIPFVQQIDSEEDEMPQQKNRRKKKSYVISEDEEFEPSSRPESVKNRAGSFSKDNQSEAESIEDSGDESTQRKTKTRSRLKLQATATPQVVNVDINSDEDFTSPPGRLNFSSASGSADWHVKRHPARSAKQTEPNRRGRRTKGKGREATQTSLTQFTTKAPGKKANGVISIDDLQEDGDSQEKAEPDTRVSGSFWSRYRKITKLRDFKHTAIPSDEEPELHRHHRLHRKVAMGPLVEAPTKQQHVKKNKRNEDYCVEAKDGPPNSRLSHRDKDSTRNEEDFGYETQDTSPEPVEDRIRNVTNMELDESPQHIAECKAEKKQPSSPRKESRQSKLSLRNKKKAKKSDDSDDEQKNAECHGNLLPMKAASKHDENSLNRTLLGSPKRSNKRRRPSGDYSASSDRDSKLRPSFMPVISNDASSSTEDETDTDEGAEEAKAAGKPDEFLIRTESSHNDKGEHRLKEEEDMLHGVDEGTKMDADVVYRCVPCIERGQTQCDNAHARCNICSIKGLPCSTERKAVAIVATEPLQDKIGIDSEGGWACEKCTLANKDEHTKCLLCESPRPNINIKDNEKEDSPEPAELRILLSSNCHLCHRKRDKVYVKCPKGSLTHGFCEKHIQSKFGIDPAALEKDPSLFPLCPACELTCPCISCQRKKGKKDMHLEPAISPSTPKTNNKNLTKNSNSDKISAVKGRIQSQAFQQSKDHEMGGCDAQAKTTFDIFEEEFQDPADDGGNDLVCNTSFPSFHDSDHSNIDDDDEGDDIWDSFVDDKENIPEEEFNYSQHFTQAAEEIANSQDRQLNFRYSPDDFTTIRPYRKLSPIKPRKINDVFSIDDEIEEFSQGKEEDPKAVSTAAQNMFNIFNNPPEPSSQFPHYMSVKQLKRNQRCCVNFDAFITDPKKAVSMNHSYEARRAKRMEKRKKSNLNRRSKPRTKTTSGKTNKRYSGSAKNQNQRSSGTYSMDLEGNGADSSWSTRKRTRKRRQSSNSKSKAVFKTGSGKEIVPNSTRRLRRQHPSTSSSVNYYEEDTSFAAHVDDSALGGFGWEMNGAMQM